MVAGQLDGDVPRAVAWSHLRGAKEESKAKTSLGDTFPEISKGMIDLIREYYEKHGSYPASSGDKAFTDLGLDPAEWKLPVDHIYYRPAGSRLNVSPESGYSLVVKSVKGKELELSAGEKWTVFYDVSRGKWYYKTASTANEVDIGTLTVVKK